MAKKTKKTVAEIVTERFTEALKRGVTPWVKPWDDWTAWSGTTGNPYHGMNALLLDFGEWVTQKTAAERGVTIHEDQMKKPSIIVHYNEYRKEVDPDAYEAMKKKSPSYWAYMEKVGAVTFKDGKVYTLEGPGLGTALRPDVLTRPDAFVRSTKL